MHKYKRIINGECHFQMIELFDDVEKAANNSNRGEFVECNIQNLKMDFAKVVKEKDGKVKNSPSKVQGSSSEETREVLGSQKKST